MQVYKRQKREIVVAKSETGLLLIVDRRYNPTRKEYRTQIVEVLKVGCTKKWADFRAKLQARRRGIKGGTKSTPNGAI